MVEFQKVLTHETFGEVELHLEVIPDLDRALDELVADLERRGLEKDPASFDLCPYFGLVWPSARGLALELAALPDAELRGKTVLELGCGLAVPALLAAKRGAQVTANDFHPEVPRFLEANLRHNQVTLDYVDHDWRRSPLPLGTFDLVLASDILYDAAHAIPVARTLARHTADGGKILLADPGRDPLDPCLIELGRLGFQRKDRVHRVLRNPALGNGTGEVEVFVIELTRPRGA